jgi:hypothetical protein
MHYTPTFTRLTSEQKNRRVLIIMRARIYRIDEMEIGLRLLKRYIIGFGHSISYHVLEPTWSFLGIIYVSVFAK